MSNPAQPRTLAGISLLLIATVIFATQDAITKRLTHEVPISQIVFVRYLAFMLFAIIYTASRQPLGRAARSAVPLQQVLRCLLLCAEIALFAYALRFLGLAEIHTIQACFPLLVTALSVPMLGEEVGWRRWLAVFIGFVGTVIILRPGTGVFNPHALLAVVCALMYALYNLLTRKVSRHDSFETSLLYFGVVGFAVSFIPAMVQWRWVDTETSLWLLAICVTSVAAHMLNIKALELAAAAVLQPFNYVILVWAILIAYVVFDEVLDAAEILGVSIVVASALYIGHREYQNRHTS